MPLLPSPTPFDDAIRQKLVDALNPLILDGLALYNAAQVAHWNVRGPNFGPLHKLFGKVRDAFDGHTDTLAELVATLGGTAAGTAEQVGEGSTVEAYPTDVTDGMEHVRLLNDRVTAWIDGAYKAAAAIDATGDVVGATVLIDVIKDVQKLGWMLGAHLQ